MDQARRSFNQYLSRRYGQSTTPKCYGSDVEIFLRSVGKKEPQDIAPADIDTFIDEQLAAGLSPVTINRRLATIHTFFEFLASEDPVPDWPNPVIWRRHKLKRGTRLPRDAPDDEVAQLFPVITSARDRAMFGLMLGTGLRVAEVASLRLDRFEAPARSDGLMKLMVYGKRQRERMVWITPSLWQAIQAWLQERPAVESDFLFLNQRGSPISVSGIQYLLRKHCKQAGVSFTCHQLRHTFTRRMVENGLPVDSLARLLGHNDLQSTQRYIDGADPTLRAEFTAAMAALESTLSDPQALLPPVPIPPRLSPRRNAVSVRDRSVSRENWQKLWVRLGASGFPGWLEQAVDGYLSWRWPTWRAQTAYQVGDNFLRLIRRVWSWLDAHRQIEGWESFHRSDLQAWLDARCQSGLKHASIKTELGMLRSLFKFLEMRDYALDPGLFRVQAPRQKEKPLPAI